MAYFRFHAAYKLMKSGREVGADDERTICDTHCRISELDGSNAKEFKWTQCSGVSCGIWVHNHCVELPKDAHVKDYQCHTCLTKE